MLGGVRGVEGEAWPGPGVAFAPGEEGVGGGPGAVGVGRGDEGG
jgi:hypothetical protein